MSLLIITLILSCSISVFAKQPFIFRDCAAADSNALMELKSASMNPDPLAIPGTVTAAGQVEVYRNASNVKAKLQVSIQRYVALFWVTVPCISNFGSCDYDPCDLLDGLKGVCPPQMVADNIPCSCDTITKGVYNLNNRKFDIPKLSGIWSWLASGDYKVDVKLVDQTSSKEIGCVHAELTIVDADDCDGFLCSIFG